MLTREEMVPVSNPALIPGEIISLSGAAADRLITHGGGDAALLYLWLLRRAGEYRPPAAAHALKWDLSRTEAAFGELVRLGLADEREKVQPVPLLEPDGPPEYTSADIAQELGNTASPFSALHKEVQRCLGKVLHDTDTKMLYTLYDYLALPAEVILLIVHWCVEETERKDGEGRKPRMTQIRKEGFVWKREGADTPEAAEGYLRRLNVLRQREEQILALCDIRGRQPVDAERRYIRSWVEMGFDNDAIRLAYEQTVLRKQSLKWPYMNSILKKWHEKNLHTVPAIEAREGPRTIGPHPNRAPAPMPAPAGEADLLARADMEQLRELMRRDRQARQEGIRDGI